MAEEQIYNLESSGSDEFVELGQNVEAHKSPFTDGDVSLSGMVSSVLKPQDDKARERIENELKKRQQRLEKRKNHNTPDWKKIIIPVLALIIIAGGVYMLYAERNRLAGWVSSIKTVRVNKNVEILESNQLVFADTFRLKLKTTPVADKATLILSGKRTEEVAGKIVSVDDRSLNWEFIAGKLARGSYSYKAFVKNTKNNQIKEIRGVFEVK